MTKPWPPTPRPPWPRPSGEHLVACASCCGTPLTCHGRARSAVNGRRTSWCSRTRRSRRALHELVRRAAERGGPAEGATRVRVSATEPAAYVSEPGQFADVIAEPRSPFRTTSTTASRRRGLTAASPILPPGRGAPRSRRRHRWQEPPSLASASAEAPRRAGPCDHRGPRATRGASRPGDVLGAPHHQPVVDRAVPRRGAVVATLGPCRATPRSSRESSVSPPCSACRASPRSRTARPSTSTAPPARFAAADRSALAQAWERPRRRRPSDRASGAGSPVAPTSSAETLNTVPARLASSVLSAVTTNSSSRPARRSTGWSRRWPAP